jgi:hypothetical protein
MKMDIFWVYANNKIGFFTSSVSQVVECVGTNPQTTFDIRVNARAGQFDVMWRRANELAKRVKSIGRVAEVPKSSCSCGYSSVIVHIAPTTLQSKQPIRVAHTRRNISVPSRTAGFTRRKLGN